MSTAPASLEVSARDCRVTFPICSSLTGVTPLNPLSLPSTDHGTATTPDHRSRGSSRFHGVRPRPSPSLNPPHPPNSALGPSSSTPTRTKPYPRAIHWSCRGTPSAIPGSTYAEQCCFIKVAQRYHLPEERIGDVLPRNTVLYTTMEPCNKRLSGNRTCVERILRLDGAIKSRLCGDPGARGVCG